MKPYLSAILAVSLLSACSNASNETSATVEQNYQYSFTSAGYASIGAQPGDTFDLKMLNAIKASKLEAYKEMAEQIYGVLITANESVQNAILIDDNIDAQVKGVVRGARVLRSYHEGDVYITELELGMQALPFLKASEFNQHSGKVIKVEDAIYY